MFDLTLLTVAQIVFWFNPVIYLIKRDLREIHEYQADDYALKRGVDARKYQMLIIRKSVGLQHFALATNFNNTYCQTKKRIAMMNTMRKNGRIYWKSLVYLPVAALALMSFGMAGNSDAAGSLTVPEGCIFVMDDNRNHSSDSRDSRLGTVDTRCVLGKAVFLAFPGADDVTGKREFGRIGLIDGVDA